MPNPNRVPAGILPGHVDMAAINTLAITYTLGVAVIDQQHRVLIGWYVALRTAPDLQPVLKALVAYAETHFYDEEVWASNCGVDIEAHQGQHRDISYRLNSIILQSKPSRLDVISMIYDWLMVHIDLEDRRLVAAVGY